jgi:cytochrome c
MPDATHKHTIAIGILAACALLAGCSADAKQLAADATGGNIMDGKTAVAHYGCGSCHTIPGVAGAHGLVGPPLTGIGKRYYVAGELANTPENLTGWIRHPHSVNPKTLMPELGVTEKDAKDIAAFLYSLD